MMSGTALAPESCTDQGAEAAGRNRKNDEWSPVVALENTVLRMQRDLEDLQAENSFLRTPKPPGLMDRPVGNSINKCLMQKHYQMAGVMPPRHYSYFRICKVMH